MTASTKLPRKLWQGMVDGIVYRIVVIDDGDDAHGRMICEMRLKDCLDHHSWRLASEALTAKVTCRVLLQTLLNAEARP